MIYKINKRNLLKIIFYTILIFLLLFIYFKNYININKNRSDVPINNKVINNNDNSDDSFYSHLSEDVDLEYYRNYYNNNDIVARLEIPNVFNIFITKSNDNEYYLNHSIKKKNDIVGTEFMDYRVNPTSKQVNIYGHNSKTYNTSFKKLENFLDKDFYLNNQYIVLQHDNGHRIYKIFAIKEVLNDFEHMIINTSDDEFISHIETLKKDAIHQTDVEYERDSNIIILQTCSYNIENAYYIIMGIEI